VNNRFSDHHLKDEKCVSVGVDFCYKKPSRHSHNNRKQDHDDDEHDGDAKQNGDDDNTQR
jgi:hypothetical protein